MNEKLENSVSKYISGKRFSHTLAVERECRRLAELYRLDADTAEKLSAAALLHDITKEIKLDGQLELCERFGIPYTDYDVLSPKVFHAWTGAALARADFPELCGDMVCGCIRYHTTGRSGMTLPEKLLYLADYIEETRTFDDCVELRKYFYDSLPGGPEDRLRHLDVTLLLSFDMTLRALVSEGSVINPNTVETRNHLIKVIYGKK